MDNALVPAFTGTCSGCDDPISSPVVATLYLGRWMHPRCRDFSHGFDVGYEQGKSERDSEIAWVRQKVGALLAWLDRYDRTHPEQAQIEMKLEEWMESGIRRG